MTSRDEERQGAKGKSYVFTSADGAMRYSLLLLAEQERVYGLYAQGEASELRAALGGGARRWKQSLTLERPALYPELRDEAFAFSLRLPPSWRETRRFSGGGTLLLQFTSPPLGADQGRQTVHASLTLTVEPLGPGGDLDTLYEASRAKLGDAFPLLSHGPWPQRLRRRDAHGDPGRRLAGQALLPGRRRARLLPDLRGPRRRLPPGLPLVRPDRRAPSRPAPRATP